MLAIHTEGLTKHYGRRQPVCALESLDLSVETGETFGFLGPNGAGKSTAIRVLLGFLRPTSGRGQVLGHDIVRDSVAVRARVGYLPSGVALYDWLTGEQLLDYFARLTGRPAVRRRELCDRLQLSAQALRRPVRDYSRGMRQKVGIVQALQHDPELAILDEPSEGLDPLMQHAFYDIVSGLRRDGRTVFFSSHVLSEVERVCDRVAIVRRGRLAAVARVSELLARRRRTAEIYVRGRLPSLAGVPGVSDIKEFDGRIVCTVEGDIEPFLSAIRAAPIVDLTIEPPRLEDAFFELYDDSDQM